MAFNDTVRRLMDKLLNREQALPPLEGQEFDEQVLDGEEGELQEQSIQQPMPITARNRGKGLGVGFTNIDLTPPFFREAVEARELKKKWIFANAGILVVVALAGSGLYASSIPSLYAARTQEQNNQKLQAAISKYQPQQESENKSGSAQVKLNQAAGNAINWSALIRAIEGTLPSGTSVSSIGINTSSTQDSGASLLIVFSAQSPLGYADTLNAVQSARGVSNVNIGGMTSTGEKGYTFSATLDYDSTIKTNRFPSSTGGN